VENKILNSKALKKDDACFGKLYDKLYCSESNKNDKRIQYVAYTLTEGWSSTSDYAPQSNKTVM